MSNDQDYNLTDTQNYSMNTTRTVNDKRSQKIQFLENENKNLSQMIEDLQTSLKINKGIIKNLVDQKKGVNNMIEYTFNQLNQENEMLEDKLRRAYEERDQLQARLFIMQQIIDNTKDKEDDVAEMFKDEIEELKENLERKEYLLQYNEQKYSEYEKILQEAAAQDDRICRRLAELNLAPKDRKISNVVLENATYKQQVEELKYENEKLRDQMEQIIAQAQNYGQEELSIFQSKAQPNMQAKIDLSKLQKTTNQRPGSDQSEYVKKLEQSVQYLNDKIQKIRIDFKNLKKDNQNLKDSNENHIFINEKLNQALKKSSQRVEDLEKILEQNGIDKNGGTSSNNSSKKQQSKESTIDSTTIDNQQRMGNNTSSSDKEKVNKQNPPMVVMGIESQKEVQLMNVDNSFGDVSSIMIRPDQLYNNFNLMEDEESPQKKKI